MPNFQTKVKKYRKPNKSNEKQKKKTSRTRSLNRSLSKLKSVKKSVNKTIKKKVSRKIIRKKAVKVAAKSLLKKILITKHEGNPIIMPLRHNDWECWQTFNPGVVLLNDNVHFIYRAIGSDGISRFGYARSADGFTIDERLSEPIYEHRLAKPTAFNYFSFASGGSFGGAEDPRLTRIDDEDKIYMTYTACDEGLRVGLTSIKIENFLNKNWQWQRPKLISKIGETHKNWVLFPEKINGQYAILHSLSPNIDIEFRVDLEFKEGEYIESSYNGDLRRKNCWDNWVRGAAAPPLKTRAGWLLFYHAMDESDPGKYKVGAMILDSENPAKIIYRADQPILEPEEYYENSGFKAGVVYVSGAVVKDGELLVYYGAADSYIGVAHANLEKFLAELISKQKPKLKTKKIKIK